MSKKLTPWFPPEVKPVRRGVYMTDFAPYEDEKQYSFWSWWGWGNQWGTPKQAENDRDGQGIQHKRWRGLASDPKGKA